MNLVGVSTIFSGIIKEPWTIQIIRDALEQWFSTFGGWRPKKQNIAQFCDPYIAIIVL